MSGPQQNNMEEILSSIRTTLEDEAAKVGSPSAPAADAEDILDLSATDMVEPLKPGEELFDINAFAMSGQQKVVAPTQVAGSADPFGEGEEPPTEIVVSEAKPLSEIAKESAEDDFDRLLAELGDAPPEEAAVPEVAAVDATPAAVEDVAMDAMSVSTDTVNEAASAIEAAPEMAEAAVESVAVAVPAAIAPVAPVVTAPLPSIPAANGTYQLSAVPMAGGLQVAFPVEVLAEVLRPLVKGWLESNLSGVVEKLVADEISKLTQQD